MRTSIAPWNPGQSPVQHGIFTTADKFSQFLHRGLVFLAGYAGAALQTCHVPVVPEFYAPEIKSLLSGKFS
jgi:hypothetical protein